MLTLLFMLFTASASLARRQCVPIKHESTPVDVTIIDSDIPVFVQGLVLVDSNRTAGTHITLFSSCGDSDPNFAKLEAAQVTVNTTTRAIRIATNISESDSGFRNADSSRFVHRRYNNLPDCSWHQSGRAPRTWPNCGEGGNVEIAASSRSLSLTCATLAGSLALGGANTRSGQALLVASALASIGTASAEDTRCIYFAGVQMTTRTNPILCSVYKNFTINGVLREFDVSYGCSVCGRPFLANSTALSAHAVHDDESVLAWNGAVDHNQAVAVNKAKADHWTGQGLGEHASIASFAAFSLQLMINGAPPQLLTAAAIVAADEVRHAEQSFALASMFAGQTVGPSAFPKQAIASMQSQTMKQMAVAAFKEGCIAETTSVIAAARKYDELAAVAASDDVMAQRELSVLRAIVADELRHSALAWRTVTWAAGVDSRIAKSINALMSDMPLRSEDAHLGEQLFAPLHSATLGRNDWRAVVETPDIESFPAQFNSLETAAIATLLKTFQ